MKMLIKTPVVALVLMPILWLLSMGSAVGEKNSFTPFESGQVRPITMSPDDRYLFAVNTPDNSL